MSPQANHLYRALETHVRSSSNVDWEFVSSTLRQIEPTAPLRSPGRALLVTILEKDPPFDVVDAFLRAFPRACRRNTSAFISASQHDNVDVVRLLSRAYFSRDSFDYCPYSWIIMDYISVPVAEIIMDEYPQGVVQHLRDSPHSLLERELITGPGPHIITGPQIRHCTLSVWLDKLLLMLKHAERLGRNGAQRGPSYPIHFLMRFITRSPHFLNEELASWVRQLSSKYPAHFSCVDENGDAPIHILLRGPLLGDGHMSALNRTRDLLDVLINSYIESAAQLTQDGRLPIHIALENGWPCCDVLLYAAPHCVSVRDPVTGLYPFQMAAAYTSAVRYYRPEHGREGHEANEVTLVYTLLRKDPMAVLSLGE